MKELIPTSMDLRRSISPTKEVQATIGGGKRPSISL
jgi:hypothetical protein